MAIVCIYILKLNELCVFIVWCVLWMNDGTADGRKPIGE